MQKPAIAGVAFGTLLSALIILPAHVAEQH